MIDIVLPLLFTGGLIALGYYVGRAREAAHFRDLDDRENRVRNIVVVDVNTLPPGSHAASGRLVMGEAVVAADYFKTFAAALRNLIGGEMLTYNTMLERARREARLRMIEQAAQLGADLILNTRFERSDVGPRLPSSEVFCYGTAVVSGRA